MVNKRNAQTITEYAIMIAIITAAIIAMQLYARRGLQGRIHDLSGQISSNQYIPGEGKTESTYIVNTQQTSEESDSLAK